MTPEQLTVLDSWEGSLNHADYKKMLASGLTSEQCYMLQKRHKTAWDVETFESEFHESEGFADVAERF